MIKIASSNTSLTDSEIESVEAELRLSLPADYKSFLSRYNGGLPSPDIIDIDGLIGSPTDVQVFFGAGSAVKACDILWNYYTFRARIPIGWLPIACDSGGSLFCISTNGIDANQIFYIDFGIESIRYYSVANTFEAFLDKIRSWEP